jgi:hypothetical protein
VLPEEAAAVTEIQFLGFLHFATLGTSAGWELLCRMTKVTSEQFRYGREHVRVWKCRKTRSKSGTKSGSKTRPGQHPQPRKRPYTGKSSLQRASKKGSKLTSKMTPKMMDKSTSKIASGVRVPTWHFSKAGLRQTAIRVPNLQNIQKRARNHTKPNEIGNFRSNGRPKKNHENDRQKQGQKRRLKILQKRTKRGSQIHPKRGQIHPKRGSKIPSRTLKHRACLTKIHLSRTPTDRERIDDGPMTGP